MRRIAAQQAGLLRELLPGPTRQTSIHLASLIPSIVVESVARLPVPGITYWANRHWHIHVREDDSADERAFTVLHQLKHIIDHPLRRAMTAFSDADWDALAKYFACHALVCEPIAARV
ncbi:ImmA/IrrE family metallo-endopeptidase [Streptomyces scabiei]|uniref:ImmA/IrrE family metallo-endopeptidase n=1 Tax=Streptomyces scabiei TaxID=1930 RepID=UPI0038F72AE4